jgi:hypothetical protein
MCVYLPFKLATLLRQRVLVLGQLRYPCLQWQTWAVAADVRERAYLVGDIVELTRPKETRTRCAALHAEEEIGVIRPRKSRAQHSGMRIIGTMPCYDTQCTPWTGLHRGGRRLCAERAAMQTVRRCRQAEHGTSGMGRGMRGWMSLLLQLDDRLFVSADQILRRQGVFARKLRQETRRHYTKAFTFRRR